MTKQTIYEVCNGKLSTCLEYLIGGLKDPQGMQVEMSTYGRFNDTGCMGCMATIAIQSITKQPLKQIVEDLSEEYCIRYNSEFYQSSYSFLGVINSNLFSVATYDIRRFEDYIDNMRQGKWNLLCAYFKAEKALPEIIEILGNYKYHTWENHDYKDFIPLLEKIVEKLKSLNY